MNPCDILESSNTHYRRYSLLLPRMLDFLHKFDAYSRAGDHEARNLYGDYCHISQDMSELMRAMSEDVLQAVKHLLGETE